MPVPPFPVGGTALDNKEKPDEVKMIRAKRTSRETAACCLNGVAASLNTERLFCRLLCWIVPFLFSSGAPMQARNTAHAVKAPHSKKTETYPIVHPVSLTVERCPASARPTLSASYSHDNTAERCEVEESNGTFERCISTSETRDAPAAPPVSPRALATSLTPDTK
ncbi:hypothetical protein EYF80_022718 [Liparis tanakae]|uniref:Uncharacterized protein n=1 Tax=Liparis tanakae TaxID=230148 RepID=A0A4Z2HQL4_9TELE|nr:hypothetical protein EYF80_022718 [Liparis tanakae]